MASLSTTMWVPLVEGHAALALVFDAVLDVDDLLRVDRDRLLELRGEVLGTLRAQAVSAVQVANGALGMAGFSPMVAAVATGLPMLPKGFKLRR